MDMCVVMKVLVMLFCVWFEYDVVAGYITSVIFKGLNKGVSMFLNTLL